MGCGVAVFDLTFLKSTRRRRFALLGPFWSGERVEEEPEGWLAWMQASLASAHGEGMDARVEATQEQLPDGLSTNPATRSRTFRAFMPGKRGRRVPLSVGYFLSGKREKVTRAPQEDESSALHDDWLRLGSAIPLLSVTANPSPRL